MLRLLGWNRIGCGKGVFKGFVERLLLTLALALLEIAIILVRFVFGLNNHFDFSASAAAPKIIHRSPLFHYRSASLVRERPASVATESDAGHTLLPNQKSELAFCGTRNQSPLASGRERGVRRAFGTPSLVSHLC